MTAAADDAGAVLRGLVARIGGSAADVVFEEGRVDHDASEPTRGAVTASYEARQGVLRLRGADPLAGAGALAHYLRRQGRRITWESPSLVPPMTAWPDAPPTTVRTPFPIRYHLNVVTHGYSTAFWDWERWERELDWMALHGVTHPLVLTAYEVVLAETLRRSGVDDEEIRRWIGGAAHIPWMAMGGMHDFGGPLPESWPQRRTDLARRVLRRAREFGMTPVLPLPGGHVPAALAGADAPEIEWQGWRTPLLDPSSTEFSRFLGRFLEAQREMLGAPGPDPVFAVDPYIESLPPSGEPEHLAAAGAGVHRAIEAAHPGATWLLQGWPFHYHRSFWTPERIGAYLSDVPHEKLLLIDLWGEHAPMWRRGMHGRRWIWTAVHNFGGRFALFGDLRGLARDVEELVERRPDGFEGVGLAPEAIENNTVFYELATDLLWDPIDVDAWLVEFAAQRYGIEDDAAVEAWRLLGRTLYAPGRTRSIPSPVIARPWSAAAPFAGQRLAGEALPPEPSRMSANIDAENDPAVLDDLPDVAVAARLLIGLGGRAPLRNGLERDAVELAGHVLAQRTRLRIRSIREAVVAGRADDVRQQGEELREDLLALDALADTRAESRVSTWIAAARAWGANPEEEAVMERDARSLISVWGHQSSGLHDYSGRHWSGLIRDVHLPRWMAWTEWLADAVDRGVEPDPEILRTEIVRIEESWRDGVGDVGRAARWTDPLEAAEAVLDRAGL